MTSATTNTSGTSGAAAPGQQTGDPSGTADSGGGTAGQAAGSRGAATKAPIVIGMVGWLSGIGASAAGPSKDALLAWTKMTNDRGGIKGHPIQLYIGDDGGNESRSVAIVRDFVENKHAIAIVNYFSASAGSVANYARQHNIPLVGGGVFQELWNTNPMMFPQMSSADGQTWGEVELAKRAGATKVATSYCAESPACAENNAKVVKHAKEVGVEVVYQGQHSFTQPDFTADCLQMQNAGAQAVLPITETNAALRMVQSCARQRFRPRWVLAVVTDDMQKIPELTNAVGVLKTFPWFLRSGPPGVREYADALRRYLPGRYASGADTLTWGWLAAKMFEKAAHNVSDTPTSKDILNGLWAMRGQTLNGLAPGRLARTFSRGKPTPETFCVFEVKLLNGKWTATHGMTPVCR